MAQSVLEILLKISGSSKAQGEVKKLGSAFKSTTGTLDKLSTTLNASFIAGLNKGSASAKDFSSMIMSVGDQAGLGVGELSRMAGATGMFTDKQLLAGNAMRKGEAYARQLVTAVQDGTMTTREAGKAWGEFAQQNTIAADKTGINMMAIVKAIGTVTAAIAVLKKVIDFTEQGAQMQRLETAGDNLARGLGENFDEIVNKIKAASLNTVSEMDVIQSANRAMMLGLGGDADKLANLMEVAAFRGRAMGLSTTQAFSDIVTGIGRMSPMILDNLGIVIDAEKRYQEYADAMGVSVDQIDSATKKQILLNGVLEDGNRQLKAAGGLIADDAVQWEIFKTNVKNATDEIKKNANEGLTPLLKAINEENLAWQLLEIAVYKGIITQNEMTGAIRAALIAGGEWEDVINDMTAAIKEYDDGIITEAELMAAAEDEAQAMADAHRELITTTGAVKTANDLAKISMRNMTEATREQYEATKDLDAQMRDLNLFVAGSMRRETENFTKQQSDLETQMADVTAEIEKAINQGYSPMSEKITGLQEKYDELKSRYDENADAHEEATKRILWDLLTQRAALDGLSAAELEVLTNIAEAWGLIDEETAGVVTAFDQAMLDLAENENVDAATNAILGIGETAGVTAEVGAKSLDALAKSEGMQALDSETTNILNTVKGIKGELESLDGKTFTTHFILDSSGRKALRGQHGLDFVVPPGFPNDTFPINVSSGEHVSVTPSYNMTINTSAPYEPIIQDFNLMKARAGVR